MKRVILASVMALFAVAASAQEAPKFFQETYPEHALKSAMEAKSVSEGEPEHALESALQARKVLEGQEAKLDAKSRELIGLGVSAQIPCSYCVYSHLKNRGRKGRQRLRFVRRLPLLRR